MAQLVTYQTEINLQSKTEGTRYDKYYNRVEHLLELDRIRFGWRSVAQWLPACHKGKSLVWISTGHPAWGIFSLSYSDENGAWVIYGVRYPKFIWAPFAQLYSLVETPQQPPFPALGLIFEGRYWLAKIDNISLWPPGIGDPRILMHSHKTLPQKKDPNTVKGSWQLFWRFLWIWSTPRLDSALQQKSHLCIPFLGTAQPQSQFPHSCACERFIYSQDQSTYFPAAE